MSSAIIPYVPGNLEQILDSMEITETKEHSLLIEPENVEIEPLLNKVLDSIVPLPFFLPVMVV